MKREKEELLPELNLITTIPVAAPRLSSRSRGLLRATKREPTIVGLAAKQTYA